MFSEILIGLGTLLVGFVGYYTLIFMGHCYKLRKFRGPFALPLVGNCYTKESLYFMRYLTRLRKVYGKVFTFFGLTKSYLVICDPHIVRRVLSDTKTFYKGADYTYHFNMAFGEGLVTSNGEKHKRDRATFGKYFIRGNISKFTKKINSICDHAMATMLNSPDNVRGKVYNVEHFFARLSLRVFMQFSLGADLSNDLTTETDVCEAVSTGSWAIGRTISLGIPMWGFIPWVQLVKNTRSETLRPFGTIVAARKKLLAKKRAAAAAEGAVYEVEEQYDDCLTAMLSDESMSEKDMCDHFTTLVCAGHDTTAYFASYMCYLLSLHPVVQDKLVSEIQLHFQAREEVTADDITSLKYLTMVMHETLRVYSIIPQLTRYSGEEVYIKEADVTIPKGVNLMMPLFLINRDPELWDRPAEFIPERFEGKGNQFTTASNGFFPFGYGTRTCIGNTLAQVESAIFLVKLLRKFRFEPDLTFKPSIFSGISLTTSNGINVVLKEL